MQLKSKYFFLCKRPYEFTENGQYDTYFNENQLPLTPSDIGPTAGAEDIESFPPGDNGIYRQNNGPYGNSGENSEEYGGNV